MPRHLGGLEFRKPPDPVQEPPTPVLNPPRNEDLRRRPLLGGLRPPMVAPQANPQEPESSDDDCDSAETDTPNPRARRPCHEENLAREIGEQYLGLMRPTGPARDHPFSTVLEDWAVDGVPVDCGPNWSQEHILKQLKRGPHPTARDQKAWDLFAEDVGYQVDAGFCRLVEWDDIKDDIPPNLKISPVACIPQTNRRDRIILDLSFGVRVGGKIVQESVNDASADIAPNESMDELGNTLPRILSYMARADPGRPIRFSKYDVSDGYWRMVVKPGEEWNFAYVLPQSPDKPLTLVVPSAIQMGWKHSPAYFCAASSTARDVAATMAGIDQPARHVAPHPLENMIAFPTEEEMRVDAEREQRSRPVPWANIEVFVDDFILMSQETRHMRQLSRAALHGLHSVFPPPSVTNHVGGKDPVSIKKLRRGDADWTIRKEVLGWLLDGMSRCISLPQDKYRAIRAELKALTRKNVSKVSLKRFQKIVGKLRFASLGLPVGRGLFTPMNFAMRGEPDHIGLGATNPVREALEDWIEVLDDIAERPTHVHEIVPVRWHYYGYCDACASGAGGVWLPLDADLPPIVWRVPFPPDIERRCKEGDGITNSDLEMAGLFLQMLVLEQMVPNLQHCNVAVWCDNTPTVAWTTKMAAKSRIPGQLLRGLALRMRSLRLGTVLPISIAGDDNKMADDASRSFKEESAFCFTNTQLLSHFATNYPPPQKASWQLATPSSELTSKVISTLRGKRLPMAEWTIPGGSSSGATGSPTRTSAEQTPTFKTGACSAEASSSAPTLLGCGQGSTAGAIRSAIKASMRRSEPSARPASWPDTQTRRSSQAPTTGS